MRATGAGEARAAASPLRAGGQTRPGGFPRQRTESAVAVGILLAVRSYLSELAARGDAGSHPRLRHDPRADAPQADGSLTEVLVTRRRRVSRFPERSCVASHVSVHRAA